MYKYLEKNYRCEYIYKNNLLVDIIEKYGLQKSSALSEFRVGTSKADLVLLDDSIGIYEIKTGLDNLRKLSKQLNDYQKLAEKVYIVTDEKYEKKLIAAHEQSNIGIIAFDDKSNLHIKKEAKHDFSFFDFDTIFKVLRKQEYLDLTAANYGNIPNIPNTKIFKECYKLLSQINLPAFQKQVLSKLKERKLNQPELLKSDKTPVALKYICNALDFNKYEYQKLYTFLDSTNSCTCPIY